MARLKQTEREGKNLRAKLGYSVSSGPVKVVSLIKKLTIDQRDVLRGADFEVIEFPPNILTKVLSTDKTDFTHMKSVIREAFKWALAKGIDIAIIDPRGMVSLPFGIGVLAGMLGMGVLSWCSTKKKITFIEVCTGDYFTTF